MVDVTHKPAQPGLGGHLRRHRIRIALWTAALEGIIVVFSHEATKWTVLFLAVIALLLWLLARNSRSLVLRQLSWIFATSQFLALVLVLLGVIVKWALVLGLILFAVLGVVYLIVDRR